MVVLEAETYGIMITASTAYAVSKRERPEELTVELESKNCISRQIMLKLSVCSYKGNRIVYLTYCHI